MSEAIVNTELFDSIMDRINIISHEPCTGETIISLNAAGLIIDRELIISYLDDAVIESTRYGPTILRGKVKSKEVADYIVSKRLFKLTFE